MKKLRLKRHGSFTIREGWIEKAINAIKDDDSMSVFSKENGVLILGVGANMVTSIRYWLVATGIIDEKTNQLSDFGELLYKYDQYLENDFSWWMIQQHLATNFVEAPVFSILTNKFIYKSFTKDAAIDFVLRYMNDNGYDMSNSNGVEQDVTVFLRTYLDEKITNPEDNLNSPLGKLKLISKSNDGLYNIENASYNKLPALVVYYSILSCIGKANAINFDDLQRIDDSPFKVLHLDNNLGYLYLNELKSLDLITHNRAAGLNMIYINKKLSLAEIFDTFFRGNGK